MWGAHKETAREHTNKLVSRPRAELLIGSGAISSKLIPLDLTSPAGDSDSLKWSPASRVRDKVTSVLSSHRRITFICTLVSLFDLPRGRKRKGGARERQGESAWF